MLLPARTPLTLGRQQRLGKDPEKYPDAKSLPHVQVALKMKSKGQAAKEGDVIPYIFCIGDNGAAKTGKAENAHHPDDVRRQGSTLKIGGYLFVPSRAGTQPASS